MTYGPRVDIEGPPPRSGLIRGVIVAAVVIAVPVALVLALVYALPKLAGKPDPPPPPDEVQVASVRSKHAAAVQKFSEIETAYRKLDTDFQAVLGFTLEDSGSKDKYSDRLLDVLTGPDPPIRAWTSLRNAAVSSREFDEKREVLRTVETKIRDLRVTLKDQYDVEDVSTWADKKLAALGGQAQNVSELHARLNPLPKKETP